MIHPLPLAQPRQQDAVRRLLRRRLTLLVAGSLFGLVLCLVGSAWFSLALAGDEEQGQPITLHALALFAALAIPLTGVVAWLIQRRISVVADELDRLAAQVGHLASDLGERNRELEAVGESMARSRELLDAVLQRMGEAVVVVEARGTPLLWNQRARTLLGLDKDDTQVGARRLMAALLSPDTLQPLPPEQSPIGRALRGWAVDDCLVQIDGPDGRRSLAASARPLIRSDGTMRGAVLVLHDVTDLRRANDLLEQRVAERSHELEATQRRLLEAAHQAGMAEVAGEILHNIGNVLTSLNVTTAVLLDRVHHSATDRIAALAERAHEDARFRERLPGHLATLAGALSEERSQLLSEIGGLREHLDHVAHIVRQQQPMSTAAPLHETVDPIALIEDALRIAFAGMIDGIAISRDFAPTEPLRTDRHRLLQILVNLLVNARRAVDAGPRREVHVCLAAGGPGVVIRVRDTGSGILPEHLPRLFDLGFTTRSDGRGHGYGLHASANAARLMGGRLGVMSDGPGNGATFTLELPMVCLVAELGST